MTKYLMVGIGGFIGAIARFWLGGYISDRMGRDFLMGLLLSTAQGLS